MDFFIGVQWRCTEFPTALVQTSKIPLQPEIDEPLVKQEV
jgi:hypothetical protein